jgi:hypothetical protein
VRVRVGVGDGGRLSAAGFVFCCSGGCQLSLCSGSCATSNGAAADELVDGCCNSSNPGGAAGEFCVSRLASSAGEAISGEVSFCCVRDAVGGRARNVTLRFSGLRVNMGRYCDCGLNPDAAFRLVFSRTVRMSCCMRCDPSATIVVAHYRRGKKKDVDR